MALPVQVIPITSTTNAAASGTGNFTAIANRWSVCILSAGNNASTVGLPTLGFTSSCDNVNFVPVSPVEVRGNWSIFDTPAQYITVNMANNAGTTTVIAVGHSD